MTFMCGANAWTAARLHMTHDLIERMVGHRTRMAQESHAHWHDGEDEQLEHYLQFSKNVDQSELRLIALAPRGWLIVALLGLAPTFSSGSNSPEQLAIAIGGILIAFRAFTAGCDQSLAARRRGYFMEAGRSFVSCRRAI